MLSLGTVALLLPLSVSCGTREPVLWSWPHNKRHIMKIMDGFHRLHMDVDRIVFDMEEYPLEAEY
jgi:hypothetical protein